MIWLYILIWVWHVEGDRRVLYYEEYIDRMECVNRYSDRFFTHKVDNFLPKAEAEEYWRKYGNKTSLEVKMILVDSCLVPKDYKKKKLVRWFGYTPKISTPKNDSLASRTMEWGILK